MESGEILGSMADDLKSEGSRTREGTTAVQSSGGYIQLSSHLACKSKSGIAVS